MPNTIICNRCGQPGFLYVNCTQKCKEWGRSNGSGAPDHWCGRRPCDCGTPTCLGWWPEWLEEGIDRKVLPMDFQVYVDMIMDFERREPS